MWQLYLLKHLHILRRNHVKVKGHWCKSYVNGQVEATASPPVLTQLVIIIQKGQTDDPEKAG